MKMMKTSQDQQGQQEYGDDVTDERLMTVGFAKFCSHKCEHTGGCRMYGKEKMFESLHWILQHFPVVC